MVRSFDDLQAWQKAHAFVLAVYAATRAFPREDQFALTIQLPRATVSVAANIAEGSARSSTADLVHFLTMADGSLAESKYLLILARDLGYLPAHEFDKLKAMAEEAGRLLGGLKRSLSSS